MRQHTAIALVAITWDTTDPQAGVAWYDLDVSVDGGPWQRVLTRTTVTTYSQQTNQPANYYTFRLTATDHVSNAARALAHTGVVRVTKCYHGATIALRCGLSLRAEAWYWLHSNHREPRPTPSPPATCATCATT